MACEFDALANLEELQFEKSPDTPNTRLQIRLELQIASEPGTEHFQPEPQTRAKLGRNALFLPDFHFRFNLELLQPNILLDVILVVQHECG